MTANSIKTADKKFCTIPWIYVSAIIGGPIGAAYLMSKNFQALGNQKAAKNTLLIAIVCTIALLVAIILIPSMPNIGILAVVLTGFFARKFQRTSIKNELNNGAKKTSSLKVLGISLLSLLCSFLIFIILASSFNPIIVRDLFYIHQGKAAFASHNYKRALHYTLPLAQEGDKKIQFFVATIYDFNLKTAASEFQARKWYTKSAKQGLSDAQYNLAVMYARGEGGKKNNDKSFYWAMKAAKQGYPGAGYLLSILYQGGLGVKPNADKSLMWLNKSAKLGYQPAVKDLKNRQF